MSKIVKIVWASRTRHIFVDGVMMCESKHKTNDGYNNRGGHYISYQLDMPNEPMSSPDMTHTCGSGIVPFLPIDEIVIPMSDEFRSYWQKKDGLKSVIPKGLLRSAICKKCQNKYDSLFVN